MWQLLGHGPHTASVQACPLEQSVTILHCGSASPGVTQSPLWQMIAGPHAQQSALTAHWERQTALTHTWLPVQSPFVWHPGLGAWFAWQIPVLQASSGPQSEEDAQAGKQVPFMQTLPADPQSLL
jgi:hypothetical protein